MCKPQPTDAPLDSHPGRDTRHLPTSALDPTEADAVGRPPVEALVLDLGADLPGLHDEPVADVERDVGHLSADAVEHQVARLELGPADPDGAGVLAGGRAGEGDAL